MTLRYCTLRIVIAVIVENKNTEIPLYIGLFQQLFSSKQQVYTPARLVRITPFGKIKTFFLSVTSCLSLQPIKSAYKSGAPNQFFSTAVSASQKSLFCRVKAAVLQRQMIAFVSCWQLSSCVMCIIMWEITPQTSSCIGILH